MQGDFGEEDDDDEGERGEGRSDEEDGLDGVDHVGPGPGAELGEPAAGDRAGRSQSGGEDSAQHGGADRAAQAAEEAGGGHGDAQPPAVDAVLHGDDEHLADHPEAEAEHDEADACGRPRRLAGDHREQHQRDGHEGQAGDRVALVAAAARDRSPGHVSGDRDPDHHRNEEQPRLGRGGAGGGLQEQRHEDVDGEQRKLEIFARYTETLAALIAQEDARTDDVEAWVAANAMIGVHRALIDHARTRLLAAVDSRTVARDVRRRGKEALATLGDGLGDLAVKGPDCEAARP